MRIPLSDRYLDCTLIDRRITGSSSTSTTASRHAASTAAAIAEEQKVHDQGNATDPYDGRDTHDLTSHETPTGGRFGVH